MQDIRLRTVSAVLLCISAFISVPGAAAAFLWWIACTGQFLRNENPHGYSRCSHDRVFQYRACTDRRATGSPTLSG